MSEWLKVDLLNDIFSSIRCGETHFSKISCSSINSYRMKEQKKGKMASCPAITNAIKAFS
jgi:hypothetical protein